MTKVYDPRVVRLAAIFAILLSFCPKMAALIGAMPRATMGGISIVLAGMISTVGIRNLCENQVDLTNERNIVIVASILGLAVGVNCTPSGVLDANLTSLHLKISGLAAGAFTGILLNAVLPMPKPKAQNSAKS